jgi:hypothetical protein
MNDGVAFLITTEKNLKNDKTEYISRNWESIDLYSERSLNSSDDVFIARNE